jgi:hypothetical protein
VLHKPFIRICQLLWDWILAYFLPICRKP